MPVHHRTAHPAVVVVGGGVAGSALALALRRLGLSCVILDRSAAPSLRVGEHLPPDAAPYLTQLGLWESFCAAGHLPSAGVKAAWGGPAAHEREYVFSPYGTGWNLDRPRFDAWLLEAACAAGAEVHRSASVGALQREAGDWVVEALVEGRRRFFRGALLVDATGRASSVARMLSSRRLTCDRMIAVIGRVNATPDPWDARLLVEAVPDGWWYAAPLPDSRTVVAAFMTDLPLDLAGQGSKALRSGALRSKILRDFWLSHLAGTALMAPRLAGPAAALMPAGQVVVRPAGTYRMEPACGPNWLAVGDAAAALDPLSSQGIMRALASGLAASRAIDRCLSGDPDALPEYAADLAWEFERQLAARARYYGWEQRWTSRPFWRRRHQDPARDTGITLDPFARLRATAEFTPPGLAAVGPGTLPTDGTTFALSDLRRLQHLCASPAPAHQVARAFQRTAPRAIDDERAIRTIEYGIACGLLEVESVDH